MDISTLTDAVDEMCRTWAAFQHENDRATGRNEESLDKMNARMNQLETAIRRERRTPTGSGDAREYGPETKAYFDYLRHGTRDEPNPGSEALTREEMKALTVGTDPTAGYLAPVEYAREIIKGEVEFSPLRTIARVRPTSRRAVQMPKRTGTFGAVWTAEAGTRAETTGLSYGLEEFPTHEMYALVDVSEQMMEDSEFSLEEELRQEFSEQFAVTEGAAFVSGNGVGKPEGLLQHAEVAETVSGSAASIGDATGQADGLIDLYHGLKTAYAVNGTWLLNRATLSEVRKLKDSQNNYIWQPGLASGVANTILGQPYVEVPDMPDVAADANPIVFGDLRRGYVIVDRINLSVLRDPFTQATSGNIRFIARRRVGGQVVLAEAIRKLKVAA
ncbi:MAG: phage major capsid protein [Proteobacteria bacterium]|nr:phage major capsid protein [Pseudomonadota bacterium]